MEPDTEALSLRFYFDDKWLYFIYKWKYRYMNRKACGFSDLLNT